MHRSLDVDGTCADPESFVRGGPSVIRLFFRGARLQRHPKAGNYRPASERPLKWCFAGGPIKAPLLNAGD